MQMKIPNAFIVGAPKCGTTAMSDYLRSHPDILVSTPKEPFHFCTDIVPNSRFADEEKYLQLFADANARKKVVLEASTLYLCSQVALQRIYQFNPSSKIVIMLRHPIELLVSYHGQVLRNTGESIENFKLAWESRVSNRGTQQENQAYSVPGFLKYDEIGKIGAQVERALHYFPRNQTHFIFYEDFRSDPRKEYQRLLAFLGLQDNGLSSFPVVNRRRKNRFQFLARIQRWDGGSIKVWVDRLKHQLKADRFSITRWIHKLNKVSDETPELDPEFQDDLRSIFSEDMKLLAQLTGRNLDHWL
jgi:Sulfotransferase domain